VLEATTPLANIEYKKQVEKKEEMVKQIVNDLHKESYILGFKYLLV